MTENNKEIQQSEQNIKGRKAACCFNYVQSTSTFAKPVANIFLYLILPLVISYCAFLWSTPYQSQLNAIETIVTETNERGPTYAVYAKKNDTSYLKHVFIVLNNLGYKRVSIEEEWDLLWAHDYPFRTLYGAIRKLRPHQLVNHFPGCGYVTNKVDLSTSGVLFMPTAFKIPEDRDAFLQYARNKPEKIFVQKSNDHRGIHIRRIEEINLDTGGSFVQEFIHPPFLVDGYKFDIGIYTAITSIDPLRIYIYKGDVLFRFCPEKYYPLDPTVLDKYIVGDDYLPIWNVPSLKKYYTRLGFSMKDTFDAYVRSIGKRPEEVWDNAYEAISEAILAKELKMKEVIERFGDGRNFFELVRFDFALDQDLNVYMMEANMSPNLSSAHFTQNQLLYEQVLYNLFSLVGVSRRIKSNSSKTRRKVEEMEVAIKNLVVLPNVCADCENCSQLECQLCIPCFTHETKRILVQSYFEHQNKMDYVRIFPPSIVKNISTKDYTLKNQLLAKWYEGKCEIDHTWCN